MFSPQFNELIIYNYYYEKNRLQKRMWQKIRQGNVFV